MPRVRIQWVRHLTAVPVFNFQSKFGYLSFPFKTELRTGGASRAQRDSNLATLGANGGE